MVVFDHLEQSVYILAVDLDGSDRTSIVGTVSEIERQMTEPNKDEALEVQLSFTHILKKTHLCSASSKQKGSVLGPGEVEQIVLSQKSVAKSKLILFTFTACFAILIHRHTCFSSIFSIMLSSVRHQKVSSKRLATVCLQTRLLKRPRGQSPEEDEALAKDLLADKKELSEHRMLVDLSRNDMSKVCDSKTIAIKKFMKIEQYSHVMHIVSEIEGQLTEGKNGIDALISCLPAGTVSGSPKVRAMQIINELEDVDGVATGGTRLCERKRRRRLRPCDPLAHH